MQTVPKNRLDKFIPRIRNVRCFTLDNGFSGAPVQDAERYLQFAVETGAKFQFNKQTMKGRGRHHSNHWFEFDVAAGA